MTILAIDPGPVESAWVRYDGRTNSVLLARKEANALVLQQWWSVADVVVIEQVRSYGMPVGAEVFDTVHWSGRFHQAALGDYGCANPAVVLVPRKDVKLHLCQSPRANDATIRQALIDKFGGKDKAIGRKSSPGPLYGLKADCWQALALGVTWWETRRG